MKTLLICYTSLHVMIAERLVKDCYLSDFYLLYICFNKTTRHEYYFERFARKAECGGTILCLHHNLRDLFDLLRWKRVTDRLAFDSIITGNMKHFHSRYVAYLLGIKKFQSFDDGSGNIVNGGYFKNMREAIIGRLIFTIMDSSYRYHNVVSKLDVHYSIYSERNVFLPYAKAIKKIDLFDDRLGEKNEFQDETANVYFGHALVEDGLCDIGRAEAIDEVIYKKYQINFFVPHPRSISQSEFKPMKDHVVEEPFAAEELVFGLLGKFKRVRVIGINSTALLNVKCTNRVDAVNIDVAGLFASGALRAAMETRGIAQITEAELYDQV